MPRQRRRKIVRRRKARKMVPGWGGAIGRMAGVGMSYVSKGGMAYKALRLARKVADAVNIEYKILDSTGLAGAVDYSGGVVTLNSVAQGTADNQRIGDSLKVQNNVLRWFMQRNGQDCLFRIILFWDEQNQITAVSDLLEATGSPQSINSPKNYDNRFRTKVIFDEVHRLTTNTPLITRDMTHAINLHTQFFAASTTIRTGALKLAVVSNVTTTNLPTYTYYNRLSFTDN